MTMPAPIAEPTSIGSTTPLMSTRCHGGVRVRGAHWCSRRILSLLLEYQACAGLVFFRVRFNFGTNNRTMASHARTAHGRCHCHVAGAGTILWHQTRPSLLVPQSAQNARQDLPPWGHPRILHLNLLLATPLNFPHLPRRSHHSEIRRGRSGRTGRTLCDVAMQ